jgi:hypothetical protein
MESPPGGTTALYGASGGDEIVRVRAGAPPRGAQGAGGDVLTPPGEPLPLPEPVSLPVGLPTPELPPVPFPVEFPDDVPVELTAGEVHPAPVLQVVLKYCPTAGLGPATKPP